MTPVPPLVFLDANVLYSRTLRDWICLLALRSGRTAFDLRWSEDVLAEWMYRLRRRKPELTDHAIGGARRRLAEAFPHAVITGYEPGSVAWLPDLDDRHVLAAALHGQVDALVTNDRAGFPDSIVQDRLEVHTPDEFLCWVAKAHAALVRPVLLQQLAFYQKNAIVTGGRSGQDLVASLRKAGAADFAQSLEGLLEGVDG